MAECGADIPGALRAGAEEGLGLARHQAQHLLQGSLGFPLTDPFPRTATITCSSHCDRRSAPHPLQGQALPVRSWSRQELNLEGYLHRYARNGDTFVGEGGIYGERERREGEREGEREKKGWVWLATMLLTLCKVKPAPSKSGLARKFRISIQERTQLQYNSIHISRSYRKVGAIDKLLTSCKVSRCLTWLGAHFPRQKLTNMFQKTGMSEALRGQSLPEHIWARQEIS